jgi:aminopeptidase N
MAKSVRIINQFKPQSYSLSLFIDPQRKKFQGSVHIKGVRRSKPSCRITLNQSGLKISKAKIIKIDKDGSEEIPVVRIVHQNKFQEVRLHTEQQLNSIKYEVHLEFSGKITTTGTNGIYTSYWHYQENQTKEIVTTQFQPHYARCLFPCIDDPEAKATFSLNLVLPSGYDKQVLFNTDQLSSASIDNGIEIKFKKTPIMSTYLLALILGDLNSVTKETKTGKKVSVWTTPDKIQHTGFALGFATDVLERLEVLFGVPCPLEKLDLVAVPDFDNGGMENWGLVTFREDLLLFDEKHSTLSDKQAVAIIIAHELAHQWFGNLVTMKWWDELWLNEGFANFMEYYIVDKIFPEWKILEAYLVSEKSSAIRADSLPSSRAIVKKVTAPHHAVEIFDSIAYEKSGNIIRMIFHLIGEDAFMRGLSFYFQNFQYSSATSKDLIGSWQKFTKLNILEFVKTWLLDPGLPLLNLEIGKNSSQILLRQSRFLSNSKLKPNTEIEAKISQAVASKSNIKPKQKEFYKNNLSNKLNKQQKSLWQIPIDFVPDEGTSLQPFIMKKEVHKIQLAKNSDLPLKLNKNGNSFYLTSYPVEYLARISQAIKNSKLSEIDTLNLICDFISLNRSAQFEPGAGAILDIFNSARNTTNSHFWSLAGSYIAYINYHLKQQKRTVELKKFVNELISEALSLVGFSAKPDESPESTATRFELLSLAALSQDPMSTKKFTDLYDLSSSIKEIEPEKRILSLYCIAKRGLEKDYYELVKAYKENIENISLRDDIAYAICLFKKPKLAKLSLSLMMDPELVRSQDVLSWLSTIVDSSKENSHSVISWVTTEDGWSWLEKDLSSHDLNSLVTIIISTAFTDSELKKLSNFILSLEKPELTKSLNEAVDIAKSRIYWHKNELPKAVDYLCNQ